ncbi:MAG TPA: aldo/keto reductase [Egicoccus sp.]|nr:aldo/keto reductase [Egicoccus sp.]HSK21600.1 aldo/keto reductase [Egicoccus sp.]
MLRDLYVLGTAQLTRRYGPLDQRTDQTLPDTRALLSLAATSGFGAVDTAPAYGNAEEAIGLSGTRLEVHTKLAADEDPTASVARSLRQLARPVLDVLYVHDARLLLDDPHGVIPAAHTLVGTTVRDLGVSVYDETEFEAAVTDGRFSVIQVPYNLVDRRFDPDRLEVAVARGIRVIARSVLLQGILVSEPDRLPTDVAHLAGVVADLRAVGRHFGRSPLELAVGWVKANDGLAGLILGAESTDQLREIAGALAAAPLADDELGALAGVELPSPAEVDPRSWMLPGWPPLPSASGNGGDGGERERR